MIDALEAGIGQFNFALEQEGRVLAQLARGRDMCAPAVLRVDPDVDGGTHAKITTDSRTSKFGVDIAGAPDIYDRLAQLDGLDLQGIARSAISNRWKPPIAGSAPWFSGCARGHTITRVDLGGGLGIAYRPEDTMPSLADYAAMVLRVTQDWNVNLTFEPGRIITGLAGVLLTRVIWVKPGATHPFVIVDAAMNGLVRPALYDAYHRFSAPAGIWLFKAMFSRGMTPGRRRDRPTACPIALPPSPMPRPSSRPFASRSGAPPLMPPTGCSP